MALPLKSDFPFFIFIPIRNMRYYCIYKSTEIQQLII